MSCTVYIHRRNVGASWIEINEGMSELSDKQVDRQNENSENKNSMFHASPHKECNENKKRRIRRKNNYRAKNIEKRLL